MPLKLNSTGGGSVTLDTPSTASAYTLTVPAITGTAVVTGSTATVSQAMLAANVAGNGPAFSAYLSAQQSAPSTGVWTKVALNTEAFDTNSNFDAATNHRFTPTVAGYYQINAQVTFASGSTSLATCGLFKNGSLYKVGDTTTASIVYQIGVNDITYFNGSTDYVEFYVYVSNSTNLTATEAYTSMSGVLVRAA